MRFKISRINESANAKKPPLQVTGKYVLKENWIVLTSDSRSFVDHQRYLPSVAEGYRTAGVFLRLNPIASFVADSVDVNGAPILTFDETLLSTNTLVLATLKEHFSQIVGLIVMETPLEYRLYG